MYLFDEKNSDELYKMYVPYIIFSDLACGVFYKLDFGSRYNSSKFYNQYVTIDDVNDLIIANINNEIKIWKFT